MLDNKRQGSVETEITPEMISAGVAAYEAALGSLDD